MKLQEKLLSIKLRKEGASYDDILKRVSVSKSTLSFWLRDLDLTEAQRKKLLKGREISRYAAGRAKQRKRVEITQRIIRESEKEFVKLANKPLFLIGLSLYWAEGDKNKQEKIKFANSDPEMIKVAMKWFREICRVPESKFRVSLHIHNLHSNQKVREYWSATTKVPLTQFYKTYIKKSSLLHRRNVLYNGTCSIVVNDKALFRKIVGWRAGLIDYFGITPRSLMDKTRDF